MEEERIHIELEGWLLRSTSNSFFTRRCGFLCVMVENYFSQLKVSVLFSSLKKETIGVFRVHIYYCIYFVQGIGVLGYLASSICNVTALHLSLSTDIQVRCGVQGFLDLMLSLLGEYLKNCKGSLSRAFMSWCTKIWSGSRSVLPTLINGFGSLLLISQALSALNMQTKSLHLLENSSLSLICIWN